MLPGHRVVRTSLREVERLYRQDYRRFVQVAAAITRDPEAAAEAVQEAFARAIRHRREFRGDAPLEAWIWRVVVNEAKRLAAARTATAEVPAAEYATDGLPSENAAVRALIAALPERQRLAIFLRYYADLDYRTIGEVLEIEMGTVSATLAAAHRSLREAIEGVKA
jgi:RNA polymerase sigma-70 factor (ECF subfamily)